MALAPVSAVVASKAIARGAARWLDNLPALVGGLERDWAITVGVAFDGASEAFVAPAALADGTRAVLKVLMTPSAPS